MTKTAQIIKSVHTFHQEFSVRTSHQDVICKLVRLVYPTTFFIRKCIMLYDLVCGKKDWLGRQVKKKVYKKIKKNDKTIETLDPNFFGGGTNQTLHITPRYNFLIKKVVGYTRRTSLHITS